MTTVWLKSTNCKWKLFTHAFVNVFRLCISVFGHCYVYHSEYVWVNFVNEPALTHNAANSTTTVTSRTLPLKVREYS